MAGGSTSEKIIKRIFWTYGPDQIPLSDMSRHYVDQNLHVETENYVPGETVLITVQNDDGSALITGASTIELKAVVGPDGTAKFLNAFQAKTVEIGVLG